MDRRALYNSLRANWLLNPALKVEPWQVENYRVFSLEELWKNLSLLGINLDRALFDGLAQSVDTPEELSEYLTSEEAIDQSEIDQIYLNVFELWRRLLPEKLSLSIFCDELDYQIQMYDEGKTTSIENISNVLANLVNLLEENEEKGEESTKLFELILKGCANDLEHFIYDFINTQFELNQYLCGKELIDSFLPYVTEKKWLKFLQVKERAINDLPAAQKLLNQLIKLAQGEEDLEFNLELLAYLAQRREEKSFINLMQPTLALLQTEEDFWDFLICCEDFFHFKDADLQEKKIYEIYYKRSQNDPLQPFSKTDPIRNEIQQVFRTS